jgi:predicted transcriptional regulator of viral defense system
MAPPPRRPGRVDAEAHLIDEEMRPPSWRAVAELAARQWGVVSLEQLRACGVGRGAIEKATAIGRLHRLHRGVYAVGHERLGREGRHLAAVLACGKRAVLSHRSAAAWWGLLQTAQAQVDVTSPHGRHGIAGVRRHQARSLAAQDTTTHQGIPITSLARTLLDLAATVRPNRLERALAQAERALHDHAAIADVLSRANGHRGSAALTRATAQEPKLTRSELEVMFLRLVRQAGLPEPESNLPIAALDHQRLDPDFYWSTYGLVVETDGWETHRTRSAFRSDRRKDAALVASGWRVLRFTYEDVAYDGATVADRLRAAAAQAA